MQIRLKAHGQNSFVPDASWRPRGSLTALQPDANDHVLVDSDLLHLYLNAGFTRVTEEVAQ